MNLKNHYRVYKQMREKYEAHLYALCYFLEDVVPLKIGFAFVRRKLRIFDAVFFRKNGKPPQRGKLQVSKAVWLGHFQFN